MTSQEDSDDDYLDDPIKLIDFEQRRISNQFDINTEEYDQADSEGELFIQKSDSNIKKIFFRNQSARTAITLPVTFFDIAQNVEYLNDCRPLFVKIVDCDKHPWYYKKYLSSNKKLNEEIIDVGVEDFQPYIKGIDCLKTSLNSKDMHNQQSKLKIRPIETPYEGLKIGNAEFSSPNSDTPLKEWQKVIKQKALDQRNESQVDFRKNLGLIGLQISHTTETIKTPEKQHYCKKGKTKSKARNEDIKSKADERDTKQKGTKNKTVKNSNILKDKDHIVKVTQLVEIRNNEVTANELAPPPEHIKEPRHASPAKKTPDNTSKVLNSVNLTATHSGFVIPKKSGPEILEKLPESIVTPSKNQPKTDGTPTLAATSSTLSKNQEADMPCKPSKNNDETLLASVSTNLTKLPNLIVTSLTKGPKLSDRVQINPVENTSSLNPVENTSSLSLPKRSECMRATNATDESNLNLVQSHFLSREQYQRQKNRINEKFKELNKEQLTISTTDSISATSNEKNKTLISFLNRKVLNYDYTDKTKAIDRNVPKDCKLDKTKKTPPKKKADKSIISVDKNRNDFNNAKLSKPQKRSNKIDPKRFTQFEETILKSKKNCLSKEGSQTKETFLNSKNGKMEKGHRSNATAYEPAILENEQKQKRVDPVTKATPANDHKVKVLSARIENKTEIEDIAEKCKTLKMGVINENSFKLNLGNPSTFGAETCKPFNQAKFKTLRPDSEACQNAMNCGQKCKNTNSAPSSFQIQRDKLPAILNKLQSPWVATPQMSVPPNNSGTNSNLKQNAHIGQKTSKKACVNVTISTSSMGPQATYTGTQMPRNGNINLPHHRNASKMTTKPALKTSFVMKMGENVNIPCHLNMPPKISQKFNMLRRKSVPVYGENKILEVYSNVMGLSNNVTPNNATPQCIFGPASTLSLNVPIVPLNQTVHASSPANLNLNSTCQAQPIPTSITLKNIERKDEASFQPGANKIASHLQNSQTNCNFNAGAEQIMPQSRKAQQFLLGKLGALQQNRNAILVTNRQSAVQSTQPKTQPNAVTSNDLENRLCIADPRQRSTQRPPPPTCNVALPLANNLLHPNESLLSAETTLKSPVSFNMPTPVPSNQTLNRGIVNNSYNPNENWHPQMTYMPQSFNMPSIVQASKQVVVNNSQHTNQPIQVKKNHNPNLSVPTPSVPSKPPPKQWTIYNPERPNEPMHSQANPKPANFDVPPPSVPATQVNHTRQPNELLHLQTTLTPPNFNVPPPPVTQGSNQGMVPQPIPILQRDIHPGYRSNMYPHFPTNIFPAGPSDDMSMQHPVYPQQDRRIDYTNSSHCEPIYDDLPKNLPVNTMPYHMHSAWNCFYPNMMVPPPRPPYPPQHYLKQTSRNVFNNPNQTDNQLAQSVAGTSVIGYNDTGLVKKININSAKVDTNDRQDPVNSAICSENVDNGSVPLGSENEPVKSKKEMLEELTRATAVISPSRSPVENILKYCAEKAKNLNDIHKDKAPSIQVSSPTEPLPSLKSNEQALNNVLSTESKNRSSPSKIDRNVNNDTSTSSPISHIKDLKRRNPQQNDISETQTLIKKPKPGPLSKKRDYGSVFTAKISDDRLPVPHKGYSPPILPIPTYTKSLEILAKCNQLEKERRMDYADNYLKESEINNAVGTTQAPEEVLRNKVTEEEKEQQEKATKKISLDEYKKRGLKSDDSKDGTELFSEEKNKLEVKRESHEQDLGYDSDSTMRL